VVFEHYFRKKVHACRGELPWKIAETRGNPVAHKRSNYQRAENKVYQGGEIKQYSYIGP